MPTTITLPDSDKEAKDGSGYSHDKRSITFSDDDIEKKGADKADDNDGEAESLSPEKNVAWEVNKETDFEFPANAKNWKSGKRTF